MPDKRSYFILSTIFISILLYIFLSGIGSYGLLAKDEPRYCSCALEMIENKDWIVPKFNFQDRFDKPVLYYWMIAVSYVLFGVNEFSSRLPSALCAIFLVLFTWYTVKKVLGSRAGFISAIVLTTSIEYLLLGRRAATDIALCLFFSGAMYSMYLGYFIKDWKVKIFWTIMSGIFAGFALLTKGPVGLVFQLGILTLFLIFRKQFDLKHLKVYFLITAVALAVALPWYLKVHFATGGEFTKVFFFTHNLERFTSVVGEHPGPFWFYFPVVIFGFMPWTIFFIPALINISKRVCRKRFNKFVLFCLIWLALVFLFFSVCKTKMATYALLLYPPMSIICAYWISIIGKKNPDIIKVTCTVLIVVIAIALMVSNFIVLGVKMDSVYKNLLLPKILFTFSCMVFGAVMISIYIKKYYQVLLAFVLVLVVPGVMLLNSGVFIYQKLTFGDLIDFAKTAKSNGAKEIISFGGYKPILVYYSRMPVDFDLKKSQLLKIRQKLLENKEVYIVGYLSDISKNKSYIKKNQDLFNRLQIIKSGKKYFLGKFV